MSTENLSKINQLLQLQPRGVIFLASWLQEQGYSLDLLKRYRSSNWFQSIGSGAMKRTGDDIGYEGALYALQSQKNSSIHIGGKTALNLLGKAQYLEVNQKNVILFGDQDESLPTWFNQYDWGVKIDYYSSSFLPVSLGLTKHQHEAFQLSISSASRAMMECLYLVPKKQELLECYEIMEGLNNLRPDSTQRLLEQCNSVKVKRLFLYMAEKAGHDWLNYLKLDKIDLGSGKRSLEKGGSYIPKYKITVPKALEEYGK